MVFEYLIWNPDCPCVFHFYPLLLSHQYFNISLRKVVCLAYLLRGVSSLSQLNEIECIATGYPIEHIVGKVFFITIYIFDITFFSLIYISQRYSFKTHSHFSKYDLCREDNFCIFTQPQLITIKHLNTIQSYS